MVGKTAEAVGENCCLYCIGYLIPYINWYCLANLRQKVREHKGIGVSKYLEAFAGLKYLLCRVRLVKIAFLFSMGCALLPKCTG